MKTALKYIGRRLADRLIDLAGIAVGVAALVLGYTATAETVNIVIDLPEALLPSELLGLMWELGNKCLESCFEPATP